MRNEPKPAVKINPEILTRVLQPAHIAAGLSLEEDEDFVCLVGGGKVLARFYALSVTPAEIHREADQFVNLGMSGIEFAKVESARADASPSTSPDEAKEARAK